MKHRHILVAIHALEDTKSQIRTKIAYHAKFHDYHNTELREICRLREAEVEEALNEFKPLLTAPIAEVNARLASAAPTPPLSPETVRIIRNSLKVHRDAVGSSFMAFAPLFRDEEAKARAESDVIAARRALDEFNAAYPEEK